MYGGFYDPEFQMFTKPLMTRLKNHEFNLLYSNITEDELKDAPENVIELVRSIPKAITKYVDLDDDALYLADTYIKERVVGKTSYTDCLHIAIATLQKADMLISWNFKHIVNVSKIRGYNSVNLKFGYSMLEIRSPRELIKYDNKE